jgi:hypothetical protein
MVLISNHAQFPSTTMDFAAFSGEIRNHLDDIIPVPILINQFALSSCIVKIKDAGAGTEKP